MLNIAICDDDLLTRTQLYNIICDYLDIKYISVAIDCYSSGINFLKKLDDGINYSCIFLDIDLKEDLNGVDIARLIRTHYKQKMIIVFVTSFTEYRNRVFSLHTFDYIDKPFKNKQIYNVLDDLFFWLNEESVFEEKLQFKTIDGLISFKKSQILFFEFLDRRVNIVTKTDTYYMYQTMKNTYKYVESYGFSIPHSSYIINLESIKVFLKIDNKVIMINNAVIPVSQLKKNKFSMNYLNFIKEKGMLR